MKKWPNRVRDSLSLLSTVQKILHAKMFLCLQARFLLKVEWVSTFERFAFSASQSDDWKRSLRAEYSVQWKSGLIHWVWPLFQKRQLRYPGNIARRQGPSQLGCHARFDDNAEFIMQSTSLVSVRITIDLRQTISLHTFFLKFFQEATSVSCMSPQRDFYSRKFVRKCPRKRPEAMAVTSRQVPELEALGFLCGKKAMTGGRMMS